MEGLPTPSSLYDESCKMYNKISKEAMAAIAVGFPKVAACATAKGLFHCTLHLPNDLMTPKFVADVLLEFEHAGYKVKTNNGTNTITVDWSGAIQSVQFIPSKNLPLPNLIPLDQVNK